MNHETVLVTGASSGIGRDLARCFAADGAQMILVARNTEALEALAEELRKTHQVQVRVRTADLSRPGEVRRIFDELTGEKITVDVLVNNAGFGANGTFAEISLARQLEMVQVNLTALTELTGLFLPGMLLRRRGGILNVGSVAGFLPGPGMTVYYATKAFVLSFSEALDEELRGTGLTVSVLCPGPTESDFGRVARGSKVRRLKTSKMSSAAVAAHGHRAYRRGVVTAVPGFQNKLFVFMNRLLPRTIPRKIVRHYNRTME